MPPHKQMIFGCPGTGKTHRLLEMAEDLARKYGGNVLLITHTNSVVTELRQRIGVSGVTISTIHSLANRLAGFGGSAAGFRRTAMDGTLAFVRAMGLPPMARVSINAYLDGHETPDNTLLYEAMVQWCRQHGVPHFDAMLREATRIQNARRIIAFRAVCLDEFQDVTPAQWRFVRSIYAPAEDVVMAGDDDQSLYAWAKATPDDIFEEARTSTHISLLDSHRVPRTVQVVAERVITQISGRRIPKIMRPRDAEGAVYPINERRTDWGLTVEHALRLATDNDPVLILARSNAILNEAADRLWVDKVPYATWGPLQHARDVSVVRTARMIAQRLKDGEATEQDYAQVSRWTGLDRPPVGTRGTIDQWPTRWRHPMPRRAQLAWDHTAATEGKPPRMILSTIHSAKGRQANTVVLLTDLPVPSKQALLRMAERDAEIRTWYVGVTRARESLLIANRRGNPVIERALRV